jgi:hypothetical protein
MGKDRHRPWEEERRKAGGCWRKYMKWIITTVITADWRQAYNRGRTYIFL